ncbi:hypothetical protein T08_12907 [Trichinella sp. T8]|nr:hypothetical protein T08_12907 [Trichinella sp. T8]
MKYNISMVYLLSFMMFGLLKPCWLSTFNFSWYEANRRTLLFFLARS